MSKGTPQKKAVFQDNFIKHWCASSHNHPEGWHWWKKRVRKDFRRKMKNQLHNEVANMED